MTLHPSVHHDFSGGLPPLVAAVIHAAGYRAGERAGNGLGDLPVVRLTDALLDAVSTLPTVGDTPTARVAGTLDTDPIPELPPLGDNGLTADTPPPPDALPRQRWVLWEWAHTLTGSALADELAADPTASGWASYPDPAYTRDPYGADPRHLAAYAAYCWAADRAYDPYVKAADALDALDRLAADRAALVDVDTLTDLTERARTSNAMPSGARARRGILFTSGAARYADAIQAAVNARTKRGGDDYPLATLHAREVRHEAHRALAARVDRLVPRLTDDELAVALRRATSQDV